jgi:hypothetical protein
MQAINEEKSLKFGLSIVGTNGKVFDNWNKIEGYFEREYSQVWSKVIGLNSEAVDSGT